MASSGRITCARCGANNFDTVTVCWKCGTPLSSVSPSPAPPTVPQQPQPSGAPAALQQVAYMGRQAASAALANRSAIWLGLLFPYIGIMVALAFMMCDDPRRQEVGRICLLWSIISTVIQLLLLIAAMLSASGLITGLLAGARGGAGGLKGIGGGLPGAE
jgi:hypothetical protein